MWYDDMFHDFIKYYDIVFKEIQQIPSSFFK